jgi:hypothetical protein
MFSSYYFDFDFLFGLLDQFRIADKYLQPYDPVRLSLMLNYSVFCYEILQNISYACEITKNTFEKAIRKLDDLEEVIAHFFFSQCAIFIIMLEYFIRIHSSVCNFDYYG